MADAPPPSTVLTRLRRAGPWLALALALAATVALVVVRGEELTALSDVAPVAVAWLVVQQLAYLVAQSGRFHVVLVRFAERPIGFAPWLRLFVVGRFLNLFVPQGGNVYRAVELHRRFDVRYVDFVAAFVNAPWLATVLNLALGAVAVAALQPTAALGGWPLWLVLSGAALAGAVAPFVALAVLPLVPRAWRPLAWLHARLAAMVHATLASLRDRRYLARVFAWTLVSFVQASAMLWYGFVALGSSVGIAEAIAFYVLLQLATYFPLTPGNVGVQELAFGALAAGFGATALDGVVVSGLVRVTGVVALVLSALPLGGIEATRAARAEGPSRYAPAGPRMAPVKPSSTDPGTRSPTIECRAR
ncbi:MAG: YbhN family protein [Trueperaceae bacterium]